MTSSEKRIDLHLHSHASGTATNWWVKGLGLGGTTRESYTSPADAYRMAKAAGMDFVTLTDHETIAGAETLTDRPDFLMGVEVMARFPEGGSTVDILIYGLDATAHAQIQARRDNVYDLVAYLREAGLVHVLAHPMFEANGPLDREGVEKRLILFGLWEYINGSRPANQNRLAQRVASEVGPEELRQLARRHNLPTPPHRRIAGTGGSDDHGGIYVGATWTFVPNVTSTSDLLAAMAAGEVRPGGEDGAVEKMIHTGVRLAGLTATESQGGEGERRSGREDEKSYSPPHRLSPSPPENKFREYLPLLAHLGGEQVRALMAGQYERRVADALGGAGSQFPVLTMLGSVGSFVDGHLFVAPYVGIHSYFGRERQKTRTLRRQLYADAAGEEHVQVGVFVDQMDEIHGVATMYRNLQRLGARPSGDRLQVVQCGGREDSGAVQIRAITELPMPLYPGRALGVPSLLDVLDHVASAGYDLIHVATPGPLGLAAVAAGLTLGLPIVGAYHTEFGQYAEVLSGDRLVAELVDVLVREFYHRCSVVAVPSAATAASLRERGYRIDHFEVLRNGVDTDLFRPDRRNEELHDRLGGGRTLLLYAGRVSREKGLDRLAAGYHALRQRRADVQLVIVGDGPYRAEMEATLGETASFTGFLRGEELARTIASCDVMLFPSTTDTLGRSVAEAQASGLPAIVFNTGGPQECIRPNISGYVVEAGDETRFWVRAEELIDAPVLRRRMARAARTFALTLSWDHVLDGLIDLYREVCGLPRISSEPAATVIEAEAAPALVGAGAS